MGRFTDRLSKAKIRRVEGSWMPHEGSIEEAVALPCAAIKAETEAAVLLLVEGDEYWVPKSHLDYADVEEDLARVSPWIAEQLGLE